MPRKKVSERTRYITEVGQELRVLYRQAALWVQDLSLKGFDCTENTSHTLFRALAQLEWWHDLNWGHRIPPAGFCFQRALESALEDVRLRLLLCHVYPKEPAQIVHMDKESYFTEGDLALIIAFSRRYKDWLTSAQVLLDKTEEKHAVRMRLTVDRVEAIAMNQLGTLIK